MEIKNFKNVEKIMDEISQKEENVCNLEDEISISLKGVLHRFFVADENEKRQYKLHKYETKTKIEQEKLDIKQLKLFLKQKCKVPFDLACYFIAGALSIIEGEVYQVLNLELEEDFFFMCGDVPMLDSSYDDVTLIASQETIKLIKDLDNQNSLESSYDVHNAINNTNYILLDTQDDLDLINYKTGKVLNELTQNHAYLEDILKDFINKKINNPTLTDKDIARIVLSEIPTKYSELINKNRMVNQPVLKKK